MAEQLVKIERENWPKLRDLYSRNDPTALLGHRVVENYIQWFDKSPSAQNINFYSLDGDWSDGTFVAIDRRYVFARTLGQSSDRLTRLLELIDLSKGFIFLHILEKEYPIILKALKSQNVPIEKDSSLLHYHLPHTCAVDFDSKAPDGFSLKRVEQRDVGIIENAWPYRDAGSHGLLEDMVRWNCQSGLYNEEGQLIAWALRWPDGSLGPLQVDGKCTRRGFGKIVCKETLRQIAALGDDNVAMVFEWNAPSRAIFEKLGFQLQPDKIYMIATAQ